MINFAVGTQGFAFAGVLPELSAELGVSIGAATACCIDRDAGRIWLRSPEVQAMRTYSGRPRSSMRFSAAAATATAVA